jgi:hypothetical protein
LDPACFVSVTNGVDDSLPLTGPVEHAVNRAGGTPQEHPGRWAVAGADKGTATIPSDLDTVGMVDDGSDDSPAITAGACGAVDAD